MNAPRPFGSEQRRDRPRDPMAPTGASTRLPTQRPRGLSASSVMGGQEHEGRKDRERSDRPPRTESEERKRRERRKERDERHKREKEKIRTGGRTKKPQGLDIIDKLDVTGIYGQGREYNPHLQAQFPTNKRSVFHHDGPFDACNPHRNVKKDRRAPMEAFPANSANMALGGAGPLNSHIDLDRFHGRGEEAFDTFGGTRKTEANIVDPTKRGEYVHGTESTGLGTSTFLDGAPASRRDITRRDSDDKPTGLAPGGGLSRKKSIAQRFRGMSNNRRGPGYETRSPEARYHQASNSNDDAIEVSPPTHKAISAGGPARAAKYNNENEVNPFDQDYENAYARKGAQIRIAEQERPSAQRNLSASSAIPTGSRLGLTRSITADSPRPGSNEGEKPSGGGGFLNRMKSLKGGRRTRPERPER